MNKHPLTLFIIIVSTFLLSGCWDVNEPQRMYYINAVGVDFKDNLYEVYVQFINFDDVAKSEQPNPEIVPAEIGYAKGRTVDEAIYKLYNSSDQKIFWGHMRYMIFSESALEDERGIPAIDTFIRYRDTRYQIWVYCTKDPINEILLTTPLLEGSHAVSKLSNPINPTREETFILPRNLRDLVIGLDEPSHEINLPYVTMKKDWATTKEATEETFFSGIGILSKDGFKGSIENVSARGFQWTHDETKQGELTIKLDNPEDYLTVSIEKLKIIVEPIIKNEKQVSFEFHININVTINGFKTKVTTDELRKKIKKEMRKEIRETYREGLKLDADIYRLSEVLYRDNVKMWKGLEKNGKIPLTEDSISKINIHINKINPGRKTFAETIIE